MADHSATPYPDRDPLSRIDYHSAFLHDVLGLSGTATEDEWEEGLRSHAREAGVDVDALQPLKPHSERTSSSHPSRRSASAYSVTSQSTGVTSHFSELSKEHYPSRRREKRSSRTSLSLRDYDVFLARGRTDEQRTSISFSRPMTPADSALSLPLYSPEPSPRRPSRMLKGLSILKLHRQDQTGRNADGCLHCPRDSLSQRRAVHRLACGHRLCTQALRSTIKAALENQEGAVPSCCGLPIPGALVQHVMTYEEQETLLDKLEQWNEAISLPPSTSRERKDRSPSPGLNAGLRKMSLASKDDSLEGNVRNELRDVQDREGYGQLRHEQIALRDSTLSWAIVRHDELQRNHERLRSEMRAHHDSAEEDMEEKHISASADAEDKQVKAEADLREAHAQEKRDNATALKHMEAYCAGEYSTGEAHHRPVTDQARTELAKARKIRDTMDSKHESAINVLRGEQARRLNLRQQRHEKALQELRRAQRKEELALARACTAEMQELQDFVVEQQRKLSARWAVQDAILAKKLDVEIGIPTLTWPSAGRPSDFGS